MTRFLIFIALALSGCATQEPSMAQNSSRPELAEPPEDGCGASKVQSFVGRTLDAATQEEVRTTSGARVVRLIRPGQAVTMDYSIDRLNIEINDREKIMTLRCG